VSSKSGRVLYRSGTPSESIEPPVGGDAHWIKFPPLDPPTEYAGVCGDSPPVPPWGGID
jgi:hypothetical protein